MNPRPGRAGRVNPRLSPRRGQHHPEPGDSQAEQDLDQVLDWLGLDRSPVLDAAFTAAHRTYVEHVAPRQRSLSPDVQAFLDQRAEREVWEQVTSQLALYDPPAVD